MHVILLQAPNFTAMKTEQQGKYMDWLLAIANTRLMYNSIAELEEFLGNHAIRSNGIRRVFNSMPKQRSAFRDLKAEASLMTDDFISLDVLMIDYEIVSKFYMKHFARRTDQHQLARQLLTYYYEPHQSDGIAKRILTIFKRVQDEDIDVALLLLLLLGAIPGYESKNGDAQDIESQWQSVMDFLDDFTKGCGGMFESLPAVDKARDETNKCRLMLIHHTKGLLGLYESYADATALYATSKDLKERRVNLEIAGYWNECGGRADDTCFWHIEETIDEGVFFGTWWYKNSDNQLVGVRYTMNLIEDDQGRLVVYMIHPEAIKHRIEGKAFDDQDHVWYLTDMPDDTHPASLHLVRSLPSNHWKGKISLTRVTDPDIISTYEKWLDTCTVVKPHGDCEYDFCYKLWGITQEAVYIYDNLDAMYFRVPRESEYDFYKIDLDNNVGILTMGNTRYLAFDEIMLYIPIEDAALRKYGITKVNVID